VLLATKLDVELTWLVHRSARVAGAQQTHTPPLHEVAPLTESVPRLVHQRRETITRKHPPGGSWPPAADGADSNPRGVHDDAVRLSNQHEGHRADICVESTTAGARSSLGVVFS
jgi:hypothetical protein